MDWISDAQLSASAGIWHFPPSHAPTYFYCSFSFIHEVIHISLLFLLSWSLLSFLMIHPSSGVS